MTEDSKTTKKGVPKKRIPGKLEGLVRIGKVRYSSKDFFSITTKHHGIYLFTKEESTIFNPPQKNKKVYCSFIGAGKYLYFIDKIANEKGEILYQRKY